MRLTHVSLTRKQNSQRSLFSIQFVFEATTSIHLFHSLFKLQFSWLWFCLNIHLRTVSDSKQKNSTLKPFAGCSKDFNNLSVNCSTIISGNVCTMHYAHCTYSIRYHWAGYSVYWIIIYLRSRIESKMSKARWNNHRILCVNWKCCGKVDVFNVTINGHFLAVWLLLISTVKRIISNGNVECLQWKPKSIRLFQSLSLPCKMFDIDVRSQ